MFCTEGRPFFISFSEHMNKVNNMRAQLLRKFKYEIDFCKMMDLMLENSPCCTMIWKCKMCSDSYTAKLAFIQVKISDNLRELDKCVNTHFKNMKSSVHGCETCRTMIPFSTCTLSYFLFVSIEKNASFSEIPEIMKVQTYNWILFGAILYINSLVEDDEGHYVASIKVNATWSVFDDRKSKPIFVSQKKKNFIHMLLYTRKLDNEPQVLEVLEKATELTSSTTSSSTNVSQKRKAENELEVLQKATKSINGTCSKATKERRTRAEINKENIAPENSFLHEIRVLSNGCSYKVDNCRVFLRNTCGFDSIVQVKIFRFIDMTL